MDKRERLFDPTDEPQSDPKSLAPRLDDLNGKTIGLLDISKKGGDIFLAHLETLLTAKYNFSQVVKLKKPTFSRPAPKEIIAELSDRCDFVVEALAD